MTFFMGQNHPPQKVGMRGIFKTAEPYSPRDACLKLNLQLKVYGYIQFQFTN